MLDCAILLYWNRLKLFTSVVVKVRRSNKHWQDLLCIYVKPDTSKVYWKMSVKTH
jgi:hypothetical protein